MDLVGTSKAPISLNSGGSRSKSSHAPVVPGIGRSGALTDADRGLLDVVAFGESEFPTVQDLTLKLVIELLLECLPQYR